MSVMVPSNILSHAHRHQPSLIFAIGLYEPKVSKMFNRTIKFYFIM